MMQEYSPYTLQERKGKDDQLTISPVDPELLLFMEQVQILRYLR